MSGDGDQINKLFQFKMEWIKMFSSQIVDEAKKQPMEQRSIRNGKVTFKVQEILHSNHGLYDPGPLKVVAGNHRHKSSIYSSFDLN